MDTPTTKSSWLDSFGTSLKQQTATWLLTAVIAIAGLFSGKLTDTIKTHLDKAKLRVSNYEAMSKDLSSFVFRAELLQEFFENDWTTKPTLTALVNDYNNSIVSLREKEFVYAGWLAQYWGDDQADIFVHKIMDQARAVDTSIHKLNDEIGKVTLPAEAQSEKPKVKMDKDIAAKGAAEIAPLLKGLRSEVRTFLSGLR